MCPSPRWFDEPDDEPDDELHDTEYPEDSDFGNSESDTIRCPECGADV
jgi:hypothetical protein